MELAFKAIDLLPLPLTKIKLRAIRELESAYSEAFGMAFKTIKEQKPKTSTILHFLTYRSLRAKGIPSQLIVEARRFAWANRCNGMPKAVPIRFDLRTFRFTKTKRGNFAIAITTLKARIGIPIRQNQCCERLKEALRQGWECRSILWSGGKFQAVLQKQFKVTEGSFVMGVDVGASRLATVCIINPKRRKVVRQLYFGQDIKHRRMLFELRRQKLQSKADKGSVRAKKALERMKHNERNFIKTRVSQIANQIVKVAKAYDASVVIEDIRYLRVRKHEMKRRSTRIINKIPYHKFFNALVNIAVRNGILVQAINPKDTSRTCPKCGLVDKRNRRNGYFRCVQCGFEANADRIASCNIALRFSYGADFGQPQTPVGGMEVMPSVHSNERC